MGFKGLIKETAKWNRVQQKRDWQMILKAVGKELPEPDWTKSVKRIDAYMEAVCQEHGLNHLEIFGCS